MKAGHLRAVIDDRVQMRRNSDGLWFRPVTAANHGAPLVRHVFQFGLRKAGRAAHGQQPFRRRTAPVVDLAASSVRS